MSGTIRRDRKFIEIEFLTNPEDLSEVGVIFRSRDGSYLTNQELLDAFSDALLLEGSEGAAPAPSSDYDA